MLAVVAAALLLRANGRPVDPNPGRMLVVGAAGVVVGGVSVLRIELLAARRDGGVHRRTGREQPGRGIGLSLEPRAGASLLRAAALLGLAARGRTAAPVAGAVEPRWSGGGIGEPVILLLLVPVVARVRPGRSGLGEPRPG